MIYRRNRTHARGWALLDMVIGLTLCSIFTGVVMVAANHAGKARQRLAQERAAVRLAEATLLHRQAAAEPPGFDGGQVSLELLSTDQPTPPGHRWARVTARYGEAEATLVGLVPEGEVP